MRDEIILRAVRPSASPDAARGYWLPHLRSGYAVPPDRRAERRERVEREAERVALTMWLLGEEEE